MTEFATLARTAITSIRKGEYTPALLLADYLQERSDPRGESLRLCVNSQQSFITSLCKTGLPIHSVVGSYTRKAFANAALAILIAKPGKRPSRSTKPALHMISPPPSL